VSHVQYSVPEAPQGLAYQVNVAPYLLHPAHEAEERSSIKEGPLREDGCAVSALSLFLKADHPQVGDLDGHCILGVPLFLLATALHKYPGSILAAAQLPTCMPRLSRDSFLLACQLTCWTN